MRHTMKMTLAALASLALIPTAMAAHTVKAPHPGTVIAATYTSNGSFHGAVDVSSGQCTYWGVETGVVGSVHWNVTIRNSTMVCFGGDGMVNPNEAKHTWADGWVFRILQFIKTDKSVDKTCDRCQVGDEGTSTSHSSPITHFQQDKSGTKDSSWYIGYAFRGDAVNRTDTLGVLD